MRRQVPLTQNSPWAAAHWLLSAHFMVAGALLVPPEPASEPGSTTQYAPCVPSPKSHIPQLCPGLQSVLTVLAVQLERHSSWTQRCPVAHFDSSQGALTAFEQ